MFPLEYLGETIVLFKVYVRKTFDQEGENGFWKNLSGGLYAKLYFVLEIVHNSSPKTQITLKFRKSPPENNLML